MTRTFAQLAPLLDERRRIAAGRQLGLRLGLAGVAALPVILTANASLGWLGHRLLTTYAPSAASPFLAALIAMTMLGLSLTYGSLPLLARWGSDLRAPLLGSIAGPGAITILDTNGSTR